MEAVFKIWYGLRPTKHNNQLVYECYVDSPENTVLKNVNEKLTLPFGLELNLIMPRKLSPSKMRYVFSVARQSETGNVHPKFYIEDGSVFKRSPFSFGTDINNVEGEVYLTADLHFFHKTVLQFSKTSRGFENLDEMHEAYIKMWKDTVKPCDTVVVLGDFSFKGVEKTQHLLSRLNGRLIFVAGNHDKKMLSSLGFKFFHYLELYYNSTLVCLMHFPISCWNGQARGSVHFHGHTHSRYSGQGRSLDVGIDNVKRLIPFKDAYLVARSRQIVCPDGRKIQS